MRNNLKLFFLCFALAITCQALAQAPVKKGNYFKTTHAEYHRKVIQPWKYDYTPANEPIPEGEIQKIGRIIFWRSESLPVNGADPNFKPSISFDIFLDYDLAYVIELTNKVRESATCDSVNMGGDIFPVGHFLLVNTSGCVNCADASSVDHCRNLIRRILQQVENTNTYSWSEIADQFLIEKRKYKGAK